MRNKKLLRNSADILLVGCLCLFCLSMFVGGAFFQGVSGTSLVVFGIFGIANFFKVLQNSTLQLHRDWAIIIGVGFAVTAILVLGVFILVTPYG